MYHYLVPFVVFGSDTQLHQVCNMQLSPVISWLGEIILDIQSVLSCIFFIKVSPCSCGRGRPFLCCLCPKSAGLCQHNATTGHAQLMVFKMLALSAGASLVVRRHTCQCSNYDEITLKRDFDEVLIHKLL